MQAKLRNASVGLAAIALAAGTALGQQQPQSMQQMTQGGNGSAKQQVQDVQQKRMTDTMESGGRMVQVPERALIELSKTPRTYFHKALDLMEEDPGKVREPIVMAADVFDLEAGRADGPMQGRMRESAVSLRKLGEDVETRTVLSKDELEQQFAQALHTLAMFEQGQAERGLRDKNVLRTATAIRQSNYDLALALVYSKQKPSPEASRAMYDADTLGEQLLNLETPTTGQLEARSDGGEPQKAADTQPPEATAKTGAEPLNGANQMAAAAMIPKEAPKVIAAMKTVLEQTKTQIDNAAKQ